MPGQAVSGSPRQQAALSAAGEAWLAGVSAANADFVFFDLETTGLSPRSDRIIEIAGLKANRRGEVSDRFHALVRIDRKLPERITTLTGITGAMLHGQESIALALPRFLAFVGDLPLVAYNAAFDMGFLVAAATRLGLGVPNVPICALALARRRLPALGSYRLAAVADHFGVGLVQKHRALDDCRLGLDVFATLMSL